MKYTKLGHELRADGGGTLQLIDHEFYYVAPSNDLSSLTHGSVSPTKVPRPGEVAWTLHNAKLNSGLLQPSAVIRPEPGTMRNGTAEEAEQTLESVRRQSFPHRPSRLRCHFLNNDEATAQFRSADSLRRSANRIVPCFIVKDTGTTFYADAGLIDQLQGSPETTRLAERYWCNEFSPQSTDECQRLEIVTDAALYFPHWQTFPTIQREKAELWTMQTELLKQFKP